MKKTIAKQLSSGLSLTNKMLKILKDTKEYYSKDPANRRSMSEDGQCMYTRGDNHCAVGRYLKPEHQYDDWYWNNGSVTDISEAGFMGNLDRVLREDVHGLDSGFWIDLQSFHDDDNNWLIWSDDDDGVRFYGLTDVGKEEYVKIEDKILNEWEKPIEGNRSQLFNYFIINKLKILMENIQEF